MARKVRRCLTKGEKSALITFLRQRYNERFFGPIRHLKAAGNYQGYGMAMMSLCSLLVESIQSCRDGLPSTHEGELKNVAHYHPPPSYDVPKAEWKNGSTAFRDFFVQYSRLFPGVDGKEFYRSIRNGLLHQAQTKNGWTIRADQMDLCDPARKILDRNLFARSLERAFNQYLKELRTNPWSSDIWKKTRRKLWWLIRLSQ